MKHVKRYRDLFEAQTPLTPEQKDWLDKCSFGKWRVNPQTGLVDVDTSFKCSLQGPIGFNGVKFGHVGKNFDCSESGLTSLDGAPKSVGGNFDCYINSLTSLEGAPRSVGGRFDCSENYLTSLEGAPQSVGGIFNCSDNSLTSLKGAPQHVDVHFICDYNNLTSLEGAPQNVGRDFYCSNNSLTSLEGAPQSAGESFYFSNNPISAETIIEVLEMMRDKKISLEQAVDDLWNDIPEEDRIYLAKHNQDLSPEEKRGYTALERFKNKVI